ncbi:MAG: MoxR family ATPase, partial [Verrucomicrobiales bacterium]|nr:MoxR family ATPase [Verrucomicrobiales bacterium]
CNNAFETLVGGRVGGAEDLIATMEAVQAVHVSEVFVKHVVELVGRTRNHADIEVGGSPRAGIALVNAARARALIHGRDYVVPDDLFALAEDVILHRTRLNYQALAEGKSGATVLRGILDSLG